MMKPSDQEKEIDWLAFQYLSGELSGDECVEFERLLETDQAAREAVAAGVEWMQAVRFAYEDELLSAPSLFGCSDASPLSRVQQQVENLPHASLGRRSPSRTAAVRRAGWALAIAVVSASLLLTLWLGPFSDRQAPIASFGNESSLTAELADMWIATRNDMASEPVWGDSTSADWLPATPVDDVDHHSLASRGFEDESGDVTMPSWLVAAVEAKQNELTEKQSNQPND